MKCSLRHRWLAVTLSAAALGATPQGLREPAPANLALIVAIDDYAQPATGGGSVPRLRGATNDAARARALLLDRFGFEADGVVTLLGPAATHAAIVRAFYDHLIRRSGPDTRVVVWFSGHGSRVPDASKADTAPRDAADESWDDTLLAYDSRAGHRRGSFDLTDDELHSLLAALPARDVVLVTDCCHSGGLFRGDGAAGGARRAGRGTRPLDRDAIRPFWPADVPFLDDDRGAVVRSTVHVAACGAMQEAGEYPGGDGRLYGTLTWFLTGALAEVDADTSWREVTEIVRARVAACDGGTRPGQLVQCSGPAERAILGGTGRPVPAGYAAAIRRGHLRVEAGRIHGVVEGTELRLVGIDGTPHGAVRVRRARATFCEAEPTDGREVPVGIALRAVPEKGLDGRAPLRIACGPGVDAAWLVECPWAVATRQAADYVLARRGERLALQTPDGAFVRDVPGSRDGARRALFREHCFRSLWEGVARPGRHEVGLAVRPSEPANGVPVAKVLGLGERRALVGAPWLPARPEVGARVVLTVTNHGTEPVNVAVLSVAEDRAVNVIWGRDTNNVLAPGASRPLTVELGPNPEWRRERPMIDRYIAIATRRYADFTPFESRAELDVTRGSGDLPTAGLPAFLAGALGGETRGGGSGGAPAWGMQWLDLELVLPARFEAIEQAR